MSGLPLLSRTILISPAACSAKNRSPLGARRIWRGAFRPSCAYNDTVNPAGATGMAPSGLGAARIKFGVALPTSGRSPTVILRYVPAFKSLASTKAPEPVITSLIALVEAHTVASPRTAPVIHINFFIVYAPFGSSGILSLFTGRLGQVRPGRSLSDPRECTARIGGRSGGG